MTVQEQLTKAEELLQELADVLKQGKNCEECGEGLSPWKLTELHYKVITFLSRRGRVYP